MRGHREERREKAGWVPGLAGPQSKSGRVGRAVATVLAKITAARPPGRTVATVLAKTTAARPPGRTLATVLAKTTAARPPGRTLATVLAKTTAARPPGRTVATGLAVLATAALAGGCETNAERSAKLEKERLAHPVAVQRGLTITRVNPDVRILETASVHDENGTAVVVRLRNTSTAALRDAPIAITLGDAAGATLYQNNAPGLEPALTTVPLLEPGREAVWVDDQIPTTAKATARVSARVGESPVVSGALPQLSVRGVHTFEDPANGAGDEGTVTNHSSVTQQKLVVYAVARHGGRVIAAGRAVLPEVPAGRSVPFQVFFIGNPLGAQLEVNAPATTFGWGLRAESRSRQAPASLRDRP